LKSDERVIKMNPYYENTKYANFKMDKMLSTIKFSCESNIRFNYAWAIKRISSFIRLYVKKDFDSIKMNILIIMIFNILFIFLLIYLKI